MNKTFYSLKVYQMLLTKYNTCVANELILHSAYAVEALREVFKVTRSAIV